MSAPRGWSSADCISGPPDETQTLTMANALLDQGFQSMGYTVITLDGAWWLPEDGNPPQPPIDQFGRFIPDTSMYPSAGNGQGLYPLSSKLHGMGLKLGIWILRGVPIAAVDAKSPIMGTPYTADQIVDHAHDCTWLGTLTYGVNMSHPGAQPYYDSVAALYASWGLDLVKADCFYGMPQYRAEIAGFSLAMYRGSANATAGGDMHLSWSPGNNESVTEAQWMNDHGFAGIQYRITGDVWDYWWHILRAMNAAIVHADLIAYKGGFCPITSPSSSTSSSSLIAAIGQNDDEEESGGDEKTIPVCPSFPDLDIVPFGYGYGSDTVAPHWTLLAPYEQITAMNLWCIFRSPLIIGALLPTDEFTVEIFTNPEVLQVNANSTDNRVISKRADHTKVIWAATPMSPLPFNDTYPPYDVYVAVFNMANGTSGSSNHETTSQATASSQFHRPRRSQHRRSSSIPPSYSPHHSSSTVSVFDTVFGSYSLNDWDHVPIAAESNQQVVYFKDLGLPVDGSVMYTVRDLWLQQTVGLFTDAFTVTLEPHYSALFRIYAYSDQ